MIYFVSLGLVLAGIIIIFIIISKKFSLLASIDLNQIAREKQAEVKKRIINEKFKRNINIFFSKVFTLVKPIFSIIAKIFNLLYNKLVNLKANYDDENSRLSEDAGSRLAVLFAEAEDFAHKSELAKAESKYIEIIGLDSKNLRAFQALGDLYYDRGNYQEAEQTLEHGIKLLEQKKRFDRNIKPLDVAKAYFSLGLVASAMSDNLKSLANIKKSLEIEPNNPRYLDKACEVCLNLKDSVSALEYCRKLEKANPSNKKLKEFKDKIKELAEETDNLRTASSINESSEQ
ncbi:MAG: hypothetical protein PHR00_04400 [Patescibacteria group bacterium]|nr:hypothetical protein [Patescibacteria group bacterium]